MTIRRPYIPLVLAACTFSIVGCAAEAAETAVVEKVPVEQAAATVIPETCEQLLPLATV